MARVTEELREYIAELVKRSNLSMRRASIAAGLNPDTIGTILRDGNQPRYETLMSIAEALDGDLHRMLALAGYMPPPAEIEDTDDADLRYDVERIYRILAQLKVYAPDKADKLIMAAIMNMEAALAAYREVEEEQLVGE